MDLLDPLHRQHVAVGLAGELVGPVARADRHGERIDARRRHEPRRLVGVGEQLIVRELAGGAVAVFGLTLAALQRPQAAELALHRHALPVGERDDLLGDLHVVVEVGRALAVFLERAVHHHAREAVVDRALAGDGRVAVVLVHGDRNARVELGRGEHQVAEVVVLAVAAGAPRGLHDHRRIGLLRRLHDRLDLLHVVDVERREAVGVFGGVVEQDPHGDEGHRWFSGGGWAGAFGGTSAAIIREKQAW